MGGLEVYLSGYNYTDYRTISDSMDIIVTIINNTTSEVTLYVSNASVNGWGTSCSCYESVKAGQKTKAEVRFYSLDDEIQSVNDITEIMLYYELRYDSYKTIAESDITFTLQE